MKNTLRPIFIPTKKRNIKPYIILKNNKNRLRLAINTSRRELKYNQLYTTILVVFENLDEGILIPLTRVAIT